MEAAEEEALDAEILAERARIHKDAEVDEMMLEEAEKPAEIENTTSLGTKSEAELVQELQELKARLAKSEMRAAVNRGVKNLYEAAVKKRREAASAEINQEMEAEEEKTPPTEIENTTSLGAKNTALQTNTTEEAAVVHQTSAIPSSQNDENQARIADFDNSSVTFTQHSENTDILMKLTGIHNDSEVTRIMLEGAEKPA